MTFKRDNQSWEDGAAANCVCCAGRHESRVLPPEPVKKLDVVTVCMPVTSVLGAHRPEREQEDLLGFLEVG